MTRGAGDGDQDFVAGFGCALPSTSLDSASSTMLGTSRFEDDGFELGGFAEPGAIAVTVA